MENQRRAKIAVISLIAGITVAGLIIISGLGVRMDLWSYRVGLTILRWLAWSGLGIFALSLIACFYVTAVPLRQGLAYATIGGLCGLVTFAIPASLVNKARSVPKIHDITTDTENPPRFVDIVPLRKKAKARNNAVYGGEKIVALQKIGYPDLRPLDTAIPVRQAFDSAIAVATSLGWQVVSSAPADGRIEAIDTTFWFGFKDDIVIRVSKLPTGSRIDIRSLSRVGRSDIGANAARIRQFTMAIKEKLKR